MSEPNLDEILEHYAVETQSGNDLKILTESLEKHPAHAGDLADFAAARAIVKHAPDEELSAEEEERFSQAGLKNLRIILASINQPDVAVDNSLQSLVETAKAKGLNRKSFATAAGLSTSLLMYLEKRRLEFSTIPNAVVEAIARLLDTGQDLVSAYLNQPPDFAAGASYKTNTRADDLPPKSFKDAVREDQQLSVEEKRKLLNLS